MVYKVLGMMSGSSLDGIDVAFVHFRETAGNWEYELMAADCYPYPSDLKKKLEDATKLSAYNYQLLHAQYGHYLGVVANQFIEENALENQVALIASHGHTSFHFPGQKFTHQLGEGSAIAAETGIAVVSDLRAIDVALGGQGAPIVPMGEKLLFPGYDFLLNLGGIANLSAKINSDLIAYDICPANRILNLLSILAGSEYDEDGKMAETGTINDKLLAELNQLAYYQLPYPKSLSNDFGIETISPLIEKYQLTIPDALATYVEHIATQIYSEVKKLSDAESLGQFKMLVTGGGAFNVFLMTRLEQWLSGLNIDIIIPPDTVVKYKEALIMALLGLLRWREENTVLASVTGASRDSVGGALWLGN